MTLGLDLPVENTEDILEAFRGSASGAAAVPLWFAPPASFDIEAVEEVCAPVVLVGFFGVA